MMETKDNVDGQTHVPSAGQPRKPDELHTLLEGVALKDKETVPSDTETSQSFAQTFNHLLAARKAHPRNAEDGQLIAAAEGVLAKQSSGINKADVETLIAFIWSIDEGRDEEEVADGVNLREARKWTYTAELMEKWQTKNCVGAAMLLTSVLKERGLETYFANPAGHAISIVRLQDGTLLYADPSTSANESKGICVDVTKGNVAMGRADGVSVLRLPSTSSTPQHYSLVPFHRSLKVGYEHVVRENDEELVELAAKGDAATSLVRRELGSKIDGHLKNCQKSEELLRLQATDAWKAELERTSKADDVQNGLAALSGIIGMEQAMEIKSLVASDQGTAAFYVQLLTSPPSKVASEFEAALQMKLPPSVPVAKFVEAHQAFWTATEGLRGIDPDAFVRSVERVLS